jgi:anti-sigma regulatory factor (Ser/Thr protein kinase)
MCRAAWLDLPASADSVGAGRAFIASLCQRWELDPGLGDDLVLATSEMITNGVLYAPGPLAVHLSVAAGQVELSVHDEVAALPSVAQSPRVDPDMQWLADRLPALDPTDPRLDTASPQPSTGALGGRGLRLINALGDSWGVAVHPAPPAGKAIWLTRAVHPSWPHHDACACRPDGPHQPTPSGRLVNHIPGPWDD